MAQNVVYKNNRFIEKEDGQIPLVLGSVLSDFYFIFIPVNILIYLAMSIISSLIFAGKRLKLYSFQLGLALALIDGNVENLQYLGVNHVCYSLLSTTPRLKMFSYAAIFHLFFFMMLSLSLYSILHFFYDKAVFMFYSNVRSIFYGNLFGMFFILKFIITGTVHALCNGSSRI